MSSFGERLRAARTAKGISQMALARQTGLSLSLIAQLEQGLTSDPKLSTLRALARALGVTLDELGQEDEPPAPPKGPRAREVM